MNHWLQSKIYECPKCEAKYLHDKGYMHEVFTCQKRNAAEPILTDGLPVPAREADLSSVSRAVNERQQNP